MGLFAKLIFLFNFTLKSNIKLIWYLNFDLHSFNCCFCNPLIKLKFFFKFHLSIFYWLRIGLHDLFQIGCFGSNDLGHAFEKLTWFFLKWLYNSFLFFYQLISILWSRPQIFRDILVGSIVITRIICLSC
jgi:hypothetical protein